MFTYLKMKKMEWNAKLNFWQTIVDLLGENNSNISTIKTLFLELSIVPPEELRSEFISKIAELAHEQAVKEREIEAGIEG